MSDEKFQYFSFSKGGLIDLELLNLPKNIVMKNMFLPNKKNLKKFWVMRIVQYFTFYNQLRMT